MSTRIVVSTDGGDCVFSIMTGDDELLRFLKFLSETETVIGGHCSLVEAVCTFEENQDPPLDGRKTIEQLSIEAAPRKLYEVSPGVDDTDWGSERQIAAQNAFYDAVKAVLSEEEWADLESYCHKATTEEGIAEAMRQVRKHT